MDQWIQMKTILPVHSKLKMQVPIELRPIATPGQLSLTQQYDIMKIFNCN